MVVRTHEDVTAAVLEVMARTPDARLREIMVALVRHLHAFVSEVALSEDEFREATALLNELGQASSATHNEAVLMAGSLGVSALVCLLNNGGDGAGETTQNLLGPFWRMGSPRVANGGTILRSPTPGLPMFVTLRLVDRAGAPVAGAEVDVWQASPAGLYENQDEGQADFNLRGKLTTDALGRVWFRSVRPAGYPIPTETLVGRLLRAQGRHPFRPAHIHALAFKPGFKTLTTQIYSDDDERLASDPQFGVTAALTGAWRRHDEPHPTHPEVGTPWYALDHTLVMEPGEARLPRPPIE
jgi:catechol 1,2-dioxygenase